MSLIDGKAIAAENRERIAKRVAEFVEKSADQLHLLLGAQIAGIHRVHASLPQM